MSDPIGMSVAKRPRIDSNASETSGLNASGTVPSPQPTSISTSADPTPVLPSVSSTPPHSLPGNSTSSPLQASDSNRLPGVMTSTQTQPGGVAPPQLQRTSPHQTQQQTPPHQTQQQQQQQQQLQQQIQQTPSQQVQQTSQNSPQQIQQQTPPPPQQRFFQQTASEQALQQNQLSPGQPSLPSNSPFPGQGGFPGQALSPGGMSPAGMGQGGLPGQGQASDPEKRKLVQQQLVLLLHAHKCQRREREQQAIGEFRPCTLPHCRTMKNVLNHMTECQAGRSCTFAHCASSHQIITHWKNCQRPDCPVCLPLKHASLQHKRENQPVGMLPGPGGGGGNRMMMVGGPPQAMLSNQQQQRPMMTASAQYNHLGPMLSDAGRPQMSYNPHSPAGGGMKPGLASDFYPSPAGIHPGMPADMAQQPRIPYPIPSIQGRPTQAWQQPVSPDLRQHLVRKIVDAIYPVQDPVAFQDGRVASLIQYVMKVEKAMFETATSEEEYYQLLAEKIYRIRKELEERRRIKNEMEKRRQLEDQKHEFDEAMQKGYVEAGIVVTLLIGAAGNGKTHVKQLVLQLPPPPIRQSTPLAESPIRAISVSRATVITTDSECVWHPMTPEEVKKMLAEGINAGVPLYSSKAEPLNSTEPSGSTEPSSIISQMFQQSSSVLASFKRIASSDSKVQAAQVSSAMAKEEFLKLIRNSSGSRKLLEVDWVYLLDSGGQPQFTEILPVFFRNSSAALLVTKLNEELDDRSMAEYYDKVGKKCGPSCTSLLTNEQTLMHYFRALQSHSFVCGCFTSTEVGAEHKPKVFVIGTYRDREHTCSETRATKNRRLATTLKPQFSDSLVFYRLGNPDELIFPVNALNPSEEDREVASQLRKEIMKYKKVAKIPLPWFVFELLVQQLTAEKGVGLLSTAECQQVATSLYMDEGGFKAALRYLVQLNIFLYYPDLLPEVIFCNTQVLLGKISELVEESYRLRGNSGTSRSGEWLRFRDDSILTVDFLKEFPSHYVEGVFSPSDLLKLLTGLNVTTQVAEGEYIMPCLRPELPTPTLDEHRQFNPTSSATPLLLQFPDKWVPLGVFTILMSTLQNTAGWKLFLDPNKSPTCLYRNCASFMLPTGDPGKVTLINSLEYIEVHMHATSQSICEEACPKICEDIFSSLQEALNALGYNSLTPKKAFLCLERSSCATTLHPASISRNYWTCSVSASVGGELTSQHHVWLKTNATTGDRPTMMELVSFRGRERRINIPEEISTKYYQFGVLLLDDSTGAKMEALDHKHLKDSERINMDVLQQWIEGKGRMPVTWQTLVDVLHDMCLTNLAADIEAVKQAQTSR